LSEETQRKMSSLATIIEICSKPDYIKILQYLDSVGEPMSPSQIEAITSVPYDKAIVACYRMVSIQILELHRNAVDKRHIRFSLLDDEMLKKIFDYYDKHAERLKTELNKEGVIEV